MIEDRPMGDAMQLELLTKGASVAVSTRWGAVQGRQEQEQEQAGAGAGAGRSRNRVQRV
jgi:hypothetical protein